MNDNGNYTIGQAAYFAGSSYTKNSDLLQEIDYVLKNLSSAVHQTAYFSVLSGGEVLYLLEERVPTPITIQAKEDINIRPMQREWEKHCSVVRQKVI